MGARGSVDAGQALGKQHRVLKRMTYGMPCTPPVPRAGLISAAPGKRNTTLQNSAKQARAGRAAAGRCCTLQLPRRWAWEGQQAAARCRKKRLACAAAAAPLTQPTMITRPAQVEAMVRMKMEQKEYIILCLEDSNDWSNATTRRLVMQACLWGAR